MLGDIDGEKFIWMGYTTGNFNGQDHDRNPFYWLVAPLLMGETWRNHMLLFLESSSMHMSHLRLFHPHFWVVKLWCLLGSTPIPWPFVIFNSATPKSSRRLFSGFPIGSQECHSFHSPTRRCVYIIHTHTHHLKLVHLGWLVPKASYSKPRFAIHVYTTPFAYFRGLLYMALSKYDIWLRVIPPWGRIPCKGYICICIYINKKTMSMDWCITQVMGRVLYTSWFHMISRSKSHYLKSLIILNLLYIYIINQRKMPW